MRTIRGGESRDGRSEPVLNVKILRVIVGAQVFHIADFSYRARKKCILRTRLRGFNGFAGLTISAGES